MYHVQMCVQVTRTETILGQFLKQKTLQVAKVYKKAFYFVRF